MTMEQRVSFGQAIGATVALVSSDLVIVLMTIAGIAAIATLIDVTAPSASNLLNIPVLVVQYYVIRRLVDRNELRSADRLGGFGAFFIAGLLTGLAMILGFVLLVLPGIYLSARWTLVDAVVVAENCGATDAMGRSWEATKGNVLPIIFAGLVISVPSIIGLGLLFSTGIIAGAQGDTQGVGPGLSAAINVLLYASQVVGWYFGMALYQLLLGEPAKAQLGEVFA
jgi:hypothetical protein